MVDVAISSQLQQWIFDKTIRPQRSNSAATSPDLCGSEALRISPTAVETPQDLETTEAIFQDRYLSSEEDLSPMESDSGEGIIFEGGDDYLSAKRISFSGPELSKACDLAVVVSYVSAGRPKIVNLPLAIRERPSRSSSLVNLSESAKPLLPQPSRLSLSTSSSGPSSASGSRRPSTANNLFSQEPSTLRISTSSASSPPTDTSSQRSASSPSATSDFKRPYTARATSSLYSKSPRTSEYPTSANSPSSPFPSLLTPATPSTPQTPSFLSSDPFANDSMSTASPIIKNAPHKRLRSISRTLSLAKIAVIPTYKKVETKKDTTRGGWGSPVSPYAPQTPIPAIVLPSPALSRGKRASQMMLRGADKREPPFELLSVPADLSDPIQRPRMVPRGADERASPIELPPFPTNDVPNIKTRRLRKRRSLIDFERLSNLK
jgi:hypothetical protein